MKQQKYDVAIVGSGIGGLSAGALLGRRGYKILVVESSGCLGGRCSTEEYEGFKLTTGAIGIHRGGAIDDVYKEVGADLDLINVPRLWYRIEGKDYEMPPKGAVKSLLDIVSKLEVQRGRLVGHIAKEVAAEKVMGFFRRGVRGQEKIEEMTFRDWLLQHTDNELAHKTFDAFSCTLIGYHTHEVSASHMFALFAKMGGWREMGIAPKGNLVNAESLAKIIKTNKGDVWANCPAKRIMVRDGVAKGVILQKEGDDIEIASEIVISNIGPKRTIGLTGENNFDDKYLARLQASIQSIPAVLTHIASDRPLCLEGGEPGSLMIVNPRRIHGVFPLTNSAPDLAPPGQHLLYCIGTPASCLKPVNVEDEIEQNTLDIKEQLPKFESHGRILKMELIYQDLPRPGMNMPQETPVKNLYNVGDAVTPPSTLAGVSGAVESGKCVAAIVEKYIKR